MIKIGINGFGRIGRAICRAIFKYSEFNEIELVGINDLASPEMLAYLLKYDSVFGKFPYEISVDGNTFIVNEKKIKIFQEENPERIPWRETGVDYVIESTRKFTNANLARKHILAGAKRVIISAPAKDEDAVIIMGVNEHIYNPTAHFIISNASCICVCLACVLNVLMKYYEIEKVSVTVVQSYTNSQRLLDGIHPWDFRKTRAAGENIIPVITDISGLMGKVLPELREKVDGISIRVPTPDVSLIDINCIIKERVTPAEVNKIFKENQNRYLKYIEEPIVSRDLIGEPYSAIIDGLATKVIDKNLIKILAWYDNEWGYSVRLLDLVKYISQKEI